MPPSRDYTVKKLLNTEEVGKAERAEKGAEKGRSDANADRPAATARSSRAARATGAHEAVVPVETASWAPIALTVLGDQAVVTRRGEEAPLNGYFLTSAPYTRHICAHFAIRNFACMLERNTMEK